MALNIFDADDAPKPRVRNTFSEDVVGRIKGGYAIGNRPVATSTWVFTTDDSDVASPLSDAFGGEIEELDVEKGDDHRIVSEAASLEVLIDSPGALRTRMVLFGLKGPIHVCDGKEFLDGEEKGEPCGCPSSYQDRKAAASSGRGPSPEISLKVKLADHPELGYLMYRTGSWTLVADLPQLEADLEAAYERSGGEPIRAALKLELVEYTTKKGRDVSYHRPVVEVHE